MTICIQVVLFTGGLVAGLHLEVSLAVDFFLVGKFSSRSTKFGAGNFPFGGNSGAK